ncbi:MAG: double-strand break repair protein AddB [Sandarakinorhabdus sp.]|nr:double-strand break repair protein AddB [Sandarakinorhabdus sp.]
MAGSERRSPLYTIPAWRPFVDDLAAGLLARFPDQMDLAHVLLVLPSRRAARALTDAFVRLSDGKALLLPRMAPAGDLDADEALGSFAGGLEEPAEVAPEMPALARRIALAKLLARGRGLQSAEALMLAGELAVALDMLEIEGKTAADIAGAVPQAILQEHWQLNARLLDTLMVGWPEVLAVRGRMDGAARRNRLLALLAQRWASQPPPHPVVLAGFASAPPAVARLARVVARLPQGMLVLPGLDTAIDAGTWAMIDEGIETHPQFAMARLLAVAGLAPGQAEPWPEAAAVGGSSPARAALVARAMTPAMLSGARIEPAAADAISGLRMVEAASPVEEALVIAITLRQVVERPGRTAALVTPDRTLARRVTVQLERFGIDIDDSAGEPLADTLPGSLLIALVVAAGECFAPVPLLALLQHPLVRAGDARLAWLNAVRQLDLLALRGPRPAPGLAGVSRRLARDRRADNGSNGSGRTAALLVWWDTEVRPLLTPLDPLPKDGRAMVDAVCSVAESLAGPGLWAGDAGSAMAKFLEALSMSDADLAELPVGGDNAAALLGGLLEGETVRPRWRRHPQVAIWGPLEARLQTADLLIMGGLNEGVWPGRPAPDPFLAPAIRRTLGLPGLARRTGMQAHDFAMGLGAPEVLLTRSSREGGAPSVPSRFWQRLEAAAGCRPDSGLLAPSAGALLKAARGLCRSDTDVRFERPRPQPPASERPRSLSVTEVPVLKADPFAFYARHMLQLKPLDPRDAEPTGGDRGQVVHKVLERWLRGERESMSLDALVDEELARLGDRPELVTLWRPRVLRMVDFVLEQLNEDADWIPEGIECAGTLDCQGVTLKGRADRIDRSPSGLRIVDYKTGSLPSVQDVRGLWQTQLALLAKMAQAGAFRGVQPADVVALDYLRLSGGREPGQMRPALGKRASADELAEHMDEAFADFQQLVGGYLLGDRPFLAKASMVHGRRFGDYDLLARVAEWLGRA